jgi:tetratricopeptide (TPR) repeat protein
MLVFVPLTAYPQEMEPPSEAQKQPPAEVVSMLLRAEGHHDLAKLYIQGGELEQAISEARRIIQLELPADYEKYVTQSLSILTEELAKLGRFDLVQPLLDEALEKSRLKINQVSLLRIKARHFMSAGENDKAIETWRKALDLESRSIP